MIGCSGGVHLGLGAYVFPFLGKGLRIGLIDWASIGLLSGRGFRLSGKETSQIDREACQEQQEGKRSETPLFFLFKDIVLASWLDVLLRLFDSFDLDHAGRRIWVLNASGPGLVEG